MFSNIDAILKYTYVISVITNIKIHSCRWIFCLVMFHTFIRQEYTLVKLKKKWIETLHLLIFIRYLLGLGLWHLLYKIKTLNNTHNHHHLVFDLQLIDLILNYTCFMHCLVSFFSVSICPSTHYQTKGTQAALPCSTAWERFVFWAKEILWS